MKQETGDRRIRHTKQALQEAMVKLLEQNPISKITVSMLCQAADINRSTFYAHYENPPQMLDQMEGEVLSGMQGYIVTHDVPYAEGELSDMLLQVLRYVVQRERLFRLLLRRNGGSDIRNRTVELLKREVRDISAPALRDDPVLLDYVLTFSVNGATSVILKWLENGRQESPEYLAGTITRLLMRNVAMI